MDIGLGVPWGDLGSIVGFFWIHFVVCLICFFSFFCVCVCVLLCFCGVVLMCLVMFDVIAVFV